MNKSDIKFILYDLKEHIWTDAFSLKAKEVMDFQRLKYFCTITETGSLTKASELLRISHSGLSKAMSGLQDELGIQLLRPQGRGLELTQEGKELYAKSKVILELVDGLARPIPARALALPKVGLAEVFSLSISGAISQELSNGAHFYEVDSGEAEIKILNNQIDFAISFIPFPHSELEYLKIKRIQMGVFVSHSKLMHTPIEDLPFVVPNSEIENNPLSIKTRDGWPLTQPRKIQFSASSLALALEIVSFGNAAIFIPKFVAERINSTRLSDFKLHELDIKKSVIAEAARDIYLVKKRNAEESREMKVVSKLIRKLC